MTEPKRYTSKKKSFVFEVDGEQFTATRSIPGGMFIDFAAALPDSNESEQAAWTKQMFAAALDEDEFERFWKFCTGPNGPDMDTLALILNDLAASEGQADRPTSPPSPSPATPLNTEASSTGG